MTRIAQFLLILGLFAALYWAGNQIWSNLKETEISIDLPDDVIPELSRAYLMPDNNSLSFSLSQAPEKIWVSSASLFRRKHSSTAQFPYTIEISVYDKNDAVLFSDEFHYRSSNTKLVELISNQQLVPESFIAKTSQQLGTAQHAHIRLPAGATKLRVTQKSKSPEIQDLVIRGYQHVQRSSRVEAISLWERLSVKQRERLTEHYPFDLSFLTDEEKASLAEFRWQPLVPEGDEGQDYDTIVLYTINDKDIAQKQYLLGRFSHQSDAYKRVSFPIEIAGKYLLKGVHSFKGRTFNVNTSWFNQNDSWEKTKSYEFTGTSFEQAVDLQPGLYVVTTSIPTSLDLFPVSGFIEEHDHFSTVFLLNEQQSLSYKMEHSGTTETPIRIQARAFAEQDAASGRGGEVYIKSFAGNELVQSAKLSLEYFPDLDSQLVNEEFFHWVAQEQEFYDEISVTVDRIEISAAQPVFISLSTRVPDIPAIRALPEEKRDWYDYSASVPDWFAVRPENYSELLNFGGVRLLRHYHKSLLEEKPVPDPDEAYQSLLGDFANLNLTDLMVQNPYPGQKTALEENTTLNYQSFDNEIVLPIAEDERELLSRRLFFIKSGSSPLQITWEKEGRPQAPFWVAGNWGSIGLESHGVELQGSLRFDAPGVRFAINDVPREQAVWQRRRAVLVLPSSEFRLADQKQNEEEVLSFVAYTTSEKPVTLTVELKDVARNPEETSEYTILKRRYEIQPKTVYSGFRLSSEQRITGRQSFSINLGKDINNTPYELILAHESGDDVFLSVVKRAAKPTPITERYRTTLEH